MYEFKVLKRWWGYSAGLLAVLVLLNWMIFGIAGSAPDWISGVMETQETRRGASLYFAFAGVGPLINIGLWVAFTHFMMESIDDVSFHDGFDGTLKQRIQLIWGCGLVWGVVLFPLVAWPYTFYITDLWGENRGFWFEPGYYFASLIGLFISGVSLMASNTSKFKRLSHRIVEAPASWGERDET